MNKNVNGNESEQKSERKAIAPTIEKIENEYNKTNDGSTGGGPLFVAIAAVAVAFAVIAAIHDWFSIHSRQ